MSQWFVWRTGYFWHAGRPIYSYLYAIYPYMLTTKTIYCKLPNKLFSKLALLLHAVHHWSLTLIFVNCIEISDVRSVYNRPIHKISSPAECTWKTKLFDLTFEPLYCQVSYHAPRPTKNFATLDRWHTRPANNINEFLKISTVTYYHYLFLLYW